MKQPRITVKEHGSDDGVHHFAVGFDGHTFDVSVSDTLAEELVPDIALAQLVRESFVFLLEREPVGSILRSFDLSVIERYFPEYRGTMSLRLR